jgi:Enoyl-(Acyl carrier protein) reductase
LPVRARGELPKIAKSLDAEVRRLDTTDETQGLALFLASPAASYVTGSQMVIDGGVLGSRRLVTTGSTDAQTFVRHASAHRDSDVCSHVLRADGRHIIAKVALGVAYCDDRAGFIHVQESAIDNVEHIGFIGVVVGNLECVGAARRLEEV